MPRRIDQVVAFLAGTGTVIDDAEWPDDYVPRRLEDGQITCVADHVWCARAREEIARVPPESPLMTPGVRAFSLFKFPEDRVYEGPILGMDACALYKTAETMMFLVDGDPSSKAERTVEWFDEFRAVYNLITRRAKILAVCEVDIDLIGDLDEYREERKVSKKPAWVESDDEDPGLVELSDASAARRTYTSLAFVFDVYSILEHTLKLVHAYKSLRLVRPRESRDGLTELRRRTIDVARSAPMRDLLSACRGYVHDLTANACDARLYARRMPKHLRPPAYAILSQKPGFIDAEEGAPKNMDELFMTTRPDFRVNMDAAFHYWASQSLDDVARAVTWANWWRTDEPPANPCIVRLAAGNTWGVAFPGTWPEVVECDSFCEAFVVLRDGSGGLDVVSRWHHVDYGFPEKRLRVVF